MRYTTCADCHPRRRAAGFLRQMLTAGGVLPARDEDFARTELYQKVYALAERSLGQPLSRQRVPQIELKGPKITRHLTTAWYAERVDGRYQRCMARAQGQ